MTEFQWISGGITAPKGFCAAGVHAGIRRNRTKKDLALIVSDVRCAAAAVYTQNKVKGAPIGVTREHLADGYAQAVIVNSGNANTCNANGVEIAEGMCRLVETHTGIAANDVIVASTGVIGQEMTLDPIAAAMEGLTASLAKNGSLAAAEAIMTTDTVVKEKTLRFMLDGKACTIGCIAKGSGMIHPNMATMLVFVTTDVAIESELLKEAVAADVKKSFNMISVDGDTSTNDMLCVMASGLAGNRTIAEKDADYDTFCQALRLVTVAVSKMIAKDGEGATKLLECRVTGASDEGSAVVIAKSVITSSLFKAAMFGADANWGRVLCAIGYSGADVDVDRIDISFASAEGEIVVCRQGSGVPFDEEAAKRILLKDEIVIRIACNDGNGEATAWGCDLTYDYVRINGDYRT